MKDFRMARFLLYREVANDCESVALSRMRARMTAHRSKPVEWLSVAKVAVAAAVIIVVFARGPFRMDQMVRAAGTSDARDSILEVDRSDKENVRGTGQERGPFNWVCWVKHASYGANWFT